MADIVAKRGPRGVGMKDDPIAWMLGGIGIATASILFMDNYAAPFGLIWNIINGEIRDVPVKYPMVVALGCFLYGVYLWGRARSQKSN